MNTNSSTWVTRLHPKRQQEFEGLTPEQQSLILNRSERHRHTALRVLIDQQKGWNGRERWVLGLEHCKAFVKDPSHFWTLIFDGQTQDIEAFWDILINFEMGLYHSIKQTDPLIFDLLSRSDDIFKRHKLDSLNPLLMAEYFQKNPERRPLPNHEVTHYCTETTPGLSMK